MNLSINEDAFQAMEGIVFSDLVRIVSPTLTLNDVRELIELYYYVDNYGEKNISLFLAMDQGGVRYCARFDFGSVSDVTITGLSPGMSLVGFDVVNVAKNGWEGINWVVEDSETGILKFFALHATVNSIVPMVSMDVLSKHLATSILRDG